MVGSAHGGIMVGFAACDHRVARHRLVGQQLLCWGALALAKELWYR
jgi:hypothetical protein